MPIKANAEIETMADQLAILRDQSVEDVVAAALRAELARETNAQPTFRSADLAPAQRGEVARILEMVRAASLSGGETGDRTVFIYDDDGLPR